MTHVEEEIGSQARCWRSARDLAAGADHLLPQHGERVAVVGCGTSWFMGSAYAALRESAGHGETDAFPGSQVPVDRPYDRILVLTRSGTTTEVLDVLRSARTARTATSVVTAVADSPAAELGDNTCVLDFADERSVVQTRFATTALALLRAHLGEDLDPAIADGEAALNADVERLTAIDQVTFLGQGWATGLAHEAALKAREAAGFWADSYPSMEYRHGPISLAQPGRAVWSLDPPPPGLEDEVLATGARFVQHGLDPMVELVVAQRFAVEVAIRRGLDPDRPRHLTRSVVLDGDSPAAPRTGNQHTDAPNPVGR